MMEPVMLDKLKPRNEEEILFEDDATFLARSPSSLFSSVRANQT